MQECKPNSVPADPNAPLSNEQSPVNDEEKVSMQEMPYREAVGCLMFAAILTRPDIMYAVSQVSRFLNNPGKEHWKAVKRILRYIQGTKYMGIKYSGSHIDFTAYSDADFAGDVDTRRSTTGYITLMAGGPVIWSSHRQKCISRSTTEAEYVAASDASQEVTWLRILLQELCVDLKNPTPLHMDNQSAIRLTKNTEHHKKTKHIDIKYHYIRECVEHGAIKIIYVCTEEQLADILTKAVPRDKFLINRTSLSIHQ
ncbi:secreted RxLR effector protein 161-like [Venturia canescens]|uniref:secreted RxLR effector protein 161-like n=1 Tax=Venturia canescens TaxID=32260 RepID=UPI001C9BC1AB|nr:secreted RxLR effector protein 161-like [Venturia canescens]